MYIDIWEHVKLIQLEHMCSIPWIIDDLIENVKIIMEHDGVFAITKLSEAIKGGGGGE